jgi:hypothetical protein
LPLARLDPSAERAAFVRRWVTLLLYELDGLGDRIRYLAAEGEPTEAAAPVRARCLTIIRSLGWNRDLVLPVVWELVEESAGRPDELWAVARVVSALEPESQRARHFLADLVPRVDTVVFFPAERLMSVVARAVYRPRRNALDVQQAFLGDLSPGQRRSLETGKPFLRLRK